MSKEKKFIHDEKMVQRARDYAAEYHHPLQRYEGNNENLLESFFLLVFD